MALASLIIVILFSPSGQSKPNVLLTSLGVALVKWGKDIKHPNPNPMACKLNESINC